MEHAGRPSHSQPPSRLVSLRALASIILLVSALSACSRNDPSGAAPAPGSGEQPTGGPTAEGEPAAAAPAAALVSSDEPAGRLAALEARLLAAENLRLVCEVSATGAYQAELEGALLLASGNRVRLEFSGQVKGQQVRMSLASDGQRMQTVSPAQSADWETPPELTKGLLIGLTRMGILHNLARLIEGLPPDATNGGIEGWLTAADVKSGGFEKIDEHRAERLEFQLQLNGTPAAEVALWLEEQSALPIRREQTVHFPDGDMQVVEIYRVVDLDPAVETAVFKLGG